jgi:hypothetical protein
VTDTENAPSLRVQATCIRCPQPEVTCQHSLSALGQDGSSDGAEVKTTVVCVFKVQHGLLVEAPLIQ